MSHFGYFGCFFGDLPWVRGLPMGQGTSPRSLHNIFQLFLHRNGETKTDFIRFQVSADRK